MDNVTCLLDELRAAHPHLGFGVYAFEPGGVVTLEIHTPDGQVYTFKGPTEEAALLSAFPPEPEAPPAPEPPVDIFA